MLTDKTGIIISNTQNVCSNFKSYSSWHFCFQITLHVHVVSLRVLMRHVSVSVVGILEFCQLKTLCWIVCAIFRKHVIFLRRRSL